MVMLAAALLLALSAGPEDAGPFPGIPWGATLERARQSYHLEPAAREGDVERYRAALERLGGAELEECQFEFTRGRFSGILLTTRGRDNTRALYRYLTGRFGKGSDDGHRFWQWLSGDTYASLDEDSAGDGYVLWYRMPAPG